MIEISELLKTYDNVSALDGLSFNIPTGSVCGFVGPNGAGKTTTMRILAGLLMADSGQVIQREEGGLKRVLIDGKNIDREYKSVIGYMPDFFGVYDRLKVSEYMEFFSSIYGLENRAAEERCDVLLKLVKLSHKKDTYVDTMSRGMKQRLCLARCLIHEPELLILDEPASGLDPRARYEFKEIIKELHKIGYTILISSHILSDMAQMCTDIAIIDKGRCVLSGTVDEIESHMHTASPIVIKTDGQVEKALRLLQSYPKVERVMYDADEIRIIYGGERQEEVMLLRRLTENGIPVYTFKREAGGLESLFMEITDVGGSPK